MGGLLRAYSPPNSIHNGILAVMTMSSEIAVPIIGQDLSNESSHHSVFQPGQRVILQSVKGDVISGTVRWAGPIRKPEVGGSIPVVGVETDKKIKPDKHFPELHLDVGAKLFKVAFNHSRVFVPEQLVVHADEYAEKQLKDIVTIYEAKQAAEEYSLEVGDIHYQQEILDKFNDLRLYEKGYASLPSRSFSPLLSPDDDPNQLTIGSMVYVPTQRDQPLYGVIKWVGTLPEFPGTIGGVELEEPLPGCTDGTWQGRRFFHCPTERGYFCPLSNLHQDIRYLDEIERIESVVSVEKTTLYDDKESYTEERNSYDNTYQEEEEYLEERVTGYRERNPCNEQALAWSYREKKSNYEAINRRQYSNSMPQLLYVDTTREPPLRTLCYPEKQDTTREPDEPLRTLYYPEKQDTTREPDEPLRTLCYPEKQVHDYEEDYRKLLSEYKVLKQDYIGTNRAQFRKDEEYRQLQESHDNLVTSYDKREESYHQLKESYRLLDQRVKLKEDEVITLHSQMRAMKESWKVSHKEVSLSKQELGRGGWGVIWLGEFRGQKVAVKQIHELIVNPHYLELLHREINTMAQLRHPNLLQFIGAVFDHPSGNPMILTEVMDTSLRAAYEGKLLTPDLPCRPVIRSIMRDVAVGLNYLHCLPDPIIHRDVSSANVLLESKGPRKWKTKISDFGSAKIARLAVTKAPGADVYCAPECLQSILEENVLQTSKVDVFSYGVMLCEVLTCRFPEAQFFREMLKQVLISTGDSLHSLIQVCVEKQPERRPTMIQVIEQFEVIMKLL